jgi:hypothetical protein
LAVVNHHIKRVQVLRIGAMPLEQICGKLTLQRRETKTIDLIAFQQELGQAIAQTANAIVKDYRL